MNTRSWFAGLATAAGFAVATFGSAAPTYAADRMQFAAANQHSPGQAGYDKTTAPATASAADTFIVPKITCGATNAGMGLGAWIFQKTTGSVTGAVVGAFCQGGSASYQPVFVFTTGGTPSSVVVHGGDKVRTIASESASSTSETIRDITTGKSQTMKGAGGTPGSVLDGIDTLRTSTGVMPIPTFVSAPFSNSSIDGGNLKASGIVPLDFYRGTTLCIHTSALNLAGNGFNEVFKHN